MNKTIKAKRCFAKMLDVFGVLKNNIIYKSKTDFLILMYHRVLPSNEKEPGMQAGMYVDPSTFDMHIRYLKRHFSIVPFFQLTSQKKDNPMKNIKNPFCIITFDDGWYDFYKFAFPILKEHKVPATVFLPTEYIGTRKLFWTDEVASIFLQKRNIRFTGNPNAVSYSYDIIKKLENLDGSQGDNIENAITILKNYSEDYIYNLLTEMKTQWGIESISRDRAFLSWEEVKKMRMSGFIFFGSHTNNHKIITYLNHNDVLEELCKSKEKLLSEGVVDPSFIPFSYPNGNYNDKVARLVQETGYHVAVTTMNGWNNHNTSLFNLQRVPIHQDISSTEAMFGCRITNIF